MIRIDHVETKSGEPIANGATVEGERVVVLSNGVKIPVMVKVIKRPTTA